MLDVAPLAGHINIKACTQVVTTSDVYNATENPFINYSSTVQAGNICSDILTYHKGLNMVVFVSNIYRYSHWQLRTDFNVLGHSIDSMSAVTTCID